MNVIKMSFEILIILDDMFPKSTLPYTSFPAVFPGWIQFSLNNILSIETMGEIRFKITLA